jgi:dipeptidase D
LFTVDEETGLNGAMGIPAGFVKGKILLNLDTEEDGSVYVGCAGGNDTLARLPIQREAAEGEAFEVKVSGLKGGHSGLDINLGRGNAIKVLGWYLDRLRREVQDDLKLVAFAGGDKHNAISREAGASILLPAGQKAKAEEVLAKIQGDLKAAFSKTDEGAKIEMASAKATQKPLTKDSRDKFLYMVMAMPHGVITMSQDVAGLVETSTNLAVAKLEDHQGVFHESSRSSVAPLLAQAQDEIIALTRLAGAEPEDGGGYPGWQPNMDSNVLARAKAVHEKVTGKVPEVKAVHAGLECGIIGEKMGGMDMISLGPQIEWPHSPSERVKIDSVERFYSFLKALLEDLSGI